MRVDLFFRVLFILYCLEAGLFLVLAPWNAGWDRLAYRIPIEVVRELLLWPVFRGAVTGFGLLHLLWGLHDLRWLLGRQRRLRRRLGAESEAAERAAKPEPPAGSDRAASPERPPAQPPPARLRDAG